jgi:hypothetical protein
MPVILATQEAEIWVQTLSQKNHHKKKARYKKRKKSVEARW